MESIKIVAICIAGAILYGILHDQVTMRICLEYFTVFHPHVFDTTSPTLLALGWGIIATWWAGAAVGVLLAASSRIGVWKKVNASEAFPLIARLFVVMAFCATLFGILGYFKGSVPGYWAVVIPQAERQRFAADYWSHNASYASGFVGGLILCSIVVFRRLTGTLRG